MEAIKKNENENVKTSIKCIEPYENLWLEEFNLDIIREPLEKTKLNWTEELDKNDIFFLDSSHIIRPDGDVLRFYLEILPKLTRKNALSSLITLEQAANAICLAHVRI